MRTLKLLLILVLLAVLALAAVFFDARQQLGAPVRLSEPRSFEIEPGQSFAASLRQLREQQLLPSERAQFYLRVYARWQGYDARIRSGEYELRPGLSSLDLLQLFMSGLTLLHELRITEGMSFTQALQLIAAEPNLRHTLGDVDPAAVMRAIGQAGEAPEGKLFPDTYRFPKHTTDVALLRQAYAMMQSVLQSEWQQRDPDLPYASADEALIMASIVEKETGAPEERAQIAGVFVRRLRLGMLLQTDPTVIYGMGAAFDGNLRLADLRRDTPYNTYTRKGLPPTPICLPGRAAIHAALHPAAGKALFFVSRGNGLHQFSETLAQHNAAVRQFQLKTP